MAINATSARALIKWPTNVSVGPKGYFRLYSEDTAGSGMNYTDPVVQRKLPAWPLKYPGGLGSGPLGKGGLGHGYRGFGLGKGALGNGPLGRGCMMLQVRGPKMTDGAYDFAVVAFDEFGNDDPSGDRTTVEVTLAGVPRPPVVPTAAWSGGTTTVTYALSADDDT